MSKPKVEITQAEIDELKAIKAKVVKEKQVVKK